jgi:K+-transporting ATPase ATPase C chain
MKMAWIAIRASIVLMVICGLIYPLVTTGIAQAIFPKQANGSLIEANGVVQGSELLAQNFQSPKFFHPRASNAKYDPKSSAGSNVAISAVDYVKGISDQIDAWKKENPSLTEVPADLVTVSGSGFDPDLSPEGAKAQVPRISAETGISASLIQQLIDKQTINRQLGIFGEPRVNVLALNLGLLQLQK